MLRRNANRSVTSNPNLETGIFLMVAQRGEPAPSLRRRGPARALLHGDRSHIGGELGHPEMYQGIANGKVAWEGAGAEAVRGQVLRALTGTQ
jgi:hypothetical protein